MDRLVDPRRFPATERAGPLCDLVDEIAAAAEPQRPPQVLRLRQAIETHLAAGDEAAIHTSMRCLTDAHRYRIFWDALVHAVEAPAAPESSAAIIARVFALPLVLVAAATRPATLAAVLPDIATLKAQFERASVLGPARSFGLANALCSLAAIEALPLLEVYRAVRTLNAAALHTRLPPEEIEVAPGREQSHLRFLCGAAITTADAPGFAEIAAHIGAWGREFSQLLGRQMTQAGVQLLVLPRPPQGMLAAALAGRHAQLEIALNLFVSNTLRRFRTTAADPVAILSTHDDGDLRLTLSSPFVADLVEGFRWPLSRLDDLSGLQDTLRRLLQDVRLSDVRGLAHVLPANRPDGSVWFPRHDEYDRLAGAPLRH